MATQSSVEDRRAVQPDTVLFNPRSYDPVDLDGYSPTPSLGRQANPGVTDRDPSDTAGHGRGTGGGGPR